MIIRDAADFDLPTIVEIYNSTISSRMVTGDLCPVALSERESWFRSHTLKRPLWVAEVDQAVVGWLSFRSFYGRPAYHITAELGIYISPTHRGQGIGSKLLLAAAQQSPDLGIANLLGFIFAHNHPSLKLFEKAGFQQWGYLPEVAEFDGILRDLVIVGLKVGATA